MPERTVGPTSAAPLVDPSPAAFEETIPHRRLSAQPLDDHAFPRSTKSPNRELLPPALDPHPPGLPGLPYTRYHEIAALMTPDEIKPEDHPRKNSTAFRKGVRRMSGFGIHEPILCGPFRGGHRALAHRRGRKSRAGFPAAAPRCTSIASRGPRDQSDQNDNVRRPSSTKLVTLIRRRLSGGAPSVVRGSPATRTRRTTGIVKGGCSDSNCFAPARSGRDRDLLTEARADFRQGIEVPLDEPVRSQRGGLLRLQARRLQDGDRRGQDDRDGDGRGVEHPQQGQRPQRRPLLGHGVDRLPERDDPQSPRRA